MSGEGKEGESKSSVRIILGTMTFAGQTDEAGTIEQLKTFIEDNKTETRSKVELDTAYMYQGTKTEELLGKVFDDDKDLRDKYIVATKVNPWDFSGKTMSAEGTRFQLETSLKNMKAESCDILYLHQPDAKTPIEETLETCHKLHTEGKFKELGLSNFAAWQVVDVWHLCDKNGWIKPTVYQGMYNAITRAVEAELFPALRKFGMRFYAYNPLAGGILTGKHKSYTEGPAETGRFKDTGGMAVMYRGRYWKAEYFDALDMVRKACDEAEVGMVEASIRWLAHHSLLDASLDDGIIIGASSTSHCRANTVAACGGPLPASVVEAFNSAWELTKPVCPMYWRK